MDLQMPVMDGFESTQKILQFLKEKPNLQSTPCNVVALTSYTDKLTKDRCYSIGMKDVIHKPLDSQNLKRIILMYHFGLSQDQYVSYKKEEEFKLRKEA